jgi:hypothetical protein
MRRQAVAYLASLLLALVCLPQFAQAQERAWKVTKWSGAVTWTAAAGQTSTVLDGAVVGPGDRLATGANGRVMMSRGSDTLVMAENSTLQVPSSEVAGSTPTIVQSRGRVSYDVEPRPMQHFIVETPHLAAVVKGTQFIVSSEQAASSVRVTRGLVEVADFRSGEVAPIGANQEATASATGRAGLALSGEGALPLVRQGPVRPGAAAGGTGRSVVLADNQDNKQGNGGQSANTTPVTVGGTGGMGGANASPAPAPEPETSLIRRIGTRLGVYPASLQNDRNDELFYGLLFAGFSGFTVMVLVMIRERRRLEGNRRSRDEKR